MKQKLKSNWLQYFAAVGGIIFVIAILEPFHTRINSATVAFAFLLVILVTATFTGRNPALLTSLFAMLGFNYFFLPPVRTWTIAEPQNLVAWAAFTVTAVIAGELSAYAKRRAEEANRGKLEIERLYRELQEAFEKASEAEALRRSEKLKSALLDAVTHDLRTPLTSIKTSVSTLLNAEEKFDLGKSGRREFYEIIDEETDRLNHFIEGMVELARIEAGELNLRRVWSEVEEIVQAALLRAEPLLENYRVKLFLEKDLPLVRVDSRAIAEVLYTLLENISKYVPENTEIEIGVKRAEKEMLEFFVSDEGAGISEDLREQIFNKFFRVSDVKKYENAPHGTGLGLAIAKGIVEAHQGKIYVTDTPNGTGAKFVFTVPIGDE